jgi:SEC-C motif domain protein
LAAHHKPAKIGAQNTEKSRKMLPKTPVSNPEQPCPCGSQQPLKDCCLGFIEGKSNPISAEQLMRSRYTAHAQLAIDYLWNSWSPEQRIHSSPADIRAWAESCEWLGLQIVSTQKGGANDESGIVEFVAIYRTQGQVQQHHEISRFKKVVGKWLYVDHQA